MALKSARLVIGLDWVQIERDSNGQSLRFALGWIDSIRAIHAAISSLSHIAEIVPQRGESLTAVGQLANSEVL